MHQFAPRTPGQLCYEAVARRTLAGREPDLDEFVVMQRPDGLGTHGIGEAVLSQLNDRLERVCPTSQIPRLLFA
jgi:hypothetical protein